MEGSDGEFLHRVSNILERLELESRRRNYAHIACLIEIARTEVEDDLRTSTEVKQTFANFQNGDRRRSRPSVAEPR